MRRATAVARTTKKRGVVRTIRAAWVPAESSWSRTSKLEGNRLAREWGRCSEGSADDVARSDACALWVCRAFCTMEDTGWRILDAWIFPVAGVKYVLRCLAV